MSNYSRYSFGNNASQRPRKRSGPVVPVKHQKNVHERSIFEGTQGYRSFFIIHPQWTSEAASAKRLSARDRREPAWENKPSFKSLLDQLMPLLDKRPGQLSREEIGTAHAQYRSANGSFRGAHAQGDNPRRSALNSRCQILEDMENSRASAMHRSLQKQGCDPVMKNNSQNGAMRSSAPISAKLRMY